MGRTRGKSGNVTCDSCGRSVPRSKALSMDKITTYSTEFKGDTEEEKINDVKTSLRREAHYCVSCGKHRHLFAKKAEMMARRKDRWGQQDKETNWGSKERF